MIVEFRAELWVWAARPDEGWTFVSLPVDESAEIKEFTAGPRRGFGAVRVEARMQARAHERVRGFLADEQRARLRRDPVARGDGELLSWLRQSIFPLEREFSKPRAQQQAARHVFQFADVARP